MQNHHNLLYREEEREMLPLLKVSLGFFLHASAQERSLTV
jgi:hypothetical protein